MAPDCRRQLFRDTFMGLARGGHRICALSGYEGFPGEGHTRHDIDVISEEPKRFPSLVAELTTATIVQSLSGIKSDYYILQCESEGSWGFIDVHVHHDCQPRSYRYLTGAEVFTSSRQGEYFELPSPEIEFTCYLLNRLTKGIGESHAARLGELYAAAPSACTGMLGRFFSDPQHVSLIAQCAMSADWQPVVRHQATLRKDMHRTARRQHPLSGARYWWERVALTGRHVLQPSGLVVAFIGTDGAGKTSVSAQVEKEMGPAFLSTTRYFRRSLSSPRRWLKRSTGESAWAPVDHWAKDRHNHPPTPAYPPAAPPMGTLGSVLKLMFWWADYTLLAYPFDIYPKVASSGLVILDRHYQDLLVYPAYYRYAGPLWLARLVGHLMPQPHLYVVLDAPVDTIQARKRDLPHAETLRQRAAYLELAARMPNAHVVDASLPLPEVVHQVGEVILDHVARRTASRIGVPTGFAPPGKPEMSQV